MLLQEHVTNSVALIFSQGSSLLECRLVMPDLVPEPGAIIELFHRDEHTRSHEHCSRCGPEPKVSYEVIEVISKGSGWEGMGNVAEDRQWSELRCKRDEWCSLFDSYTIAGYLGLELEQISDEMPSEILIVVVKGGTDSVLNPGEVTI